MKICFFHIFSYCLIVYGRSQNTQLLIATIFKKLQSYVFYSLVTKWDIKSCGAWYGAAKISEKKCGCGAVWGKTLPFVFIFRMLHAFIRTKDLFQHQNAVDSIKQVAYLRCCRVLAFSISNVCYRNYNSIMSQ